MRTLLSPLVLLLLLLLPMAGRLQAAEPILLEEIVVHGARETSTQENLTIREVRESPARDIGEALESLPGLTSLRKGSIANDIVLRGFQRDNINVMLDGVRLYGGCPSRMDPPSFHFDFAEVDFIDVVKGPYDLRYPGSLGGLVNAVSKQPKAGPGATAVVTYGSYDMLHAAVTGSYGAENDEILAGYAYKYSLPPKSGDGKRITDIYPVGSRNRYRAEDIDSKAYDIDTYWIKGGHRWTANSRTELGYSYQDAEHVLYPGLLMDAEYDRTHRLNWLTTVDNLAENFEQLEFQIYWNRVDHLMNDQYRESSRPSPMVTRDVMMETDADSTVAGGNLRGKFKLGPGQLASGIDYYYRNWNASNESAMYLGYFSQPMIPDVDVDHFGGFAEYRWPLSDQLVLKAGARLDYAASDATRLDAGRIAALYAPYHPGASLDNDTDSLEPTANLQLFWTPTETLELFVGLASASRVPDPQELYIGLQRIPTMMQPTATNWIGNPDLDPVRNNQADLGVKLSGDDFYLNASLFYSELEDYIYLAEVVDPDGPGMGTLPAARTYQNIDARIWGGELSGQAALPMNTYFQASLSYTEGKNRDSGNPLAEIAPLMGKVALRYDNDTFFVELAERYAARQDRKDSSLGEEATPGWGVTDLKAGVKIKRWSLDAGINNLFDKYYQTHMSFQRDPFRTGVRVPETGAFAYLTLAYRY